jgi:hypothetical protein
MKYERWSIRIGLRVHFKSSEGDRYLCGRRAVVGHQKVMMTINVCQRCRHKREILERSKRT